VKGRQCKETKENGQACRAFAMAGNEYCFAHAPEAKVAHLEASAKGGSVTQWRGSELVRAAGQVKTPKDVLEVLDQTLAGVQAGIIPPAVAGSIVYVCNAILSAFRVMYESREASSEGPLIVTYPVYKSPKDEHVRKRKTRALKELDGDSTREK